MYVNGKIRHIETSRNWRKEKKENDGGGEINYDMLRTFVNNTLYPHSKNNKK
jgi:hypothetical protein